MPQVESVSLPLAIVDFLPVALLAAALLFTARLAGRADRRLGDLARTGMIVVTIGGLARAVWKVVVAVAGDDIEVLGHTPIGLIMPGFVFVALAFLAATGIERARRPARVISRTAVAFLVLALGFGLGQSAVLAIELILRVITLIAATALLARGLQVSRERSVAPAVPLFLFALGSLYPVVVLGALDRGSVLLWVELVLLTAASAAYARAAWLLTVRAPAPA